MTDVGKCYVGAVDFEFRIDISKYGATTVGATKMELHVIKPDGNTAIWTCTAYDSKKIMHKTLEGDVPLKGTYAINSYMENAAGAKLHGDTIYEYVYAEGD